MATYHEFDEKAIAAALEAARGFHDPKALAASAQVNPFDDGHLRLAASCISVTVDNGKVCLNLPLGIGQVCVPIPAIFPNGTAAQACLDICTTWGIPTGVRLTVSIAGQTIV
ncbi:MAG: hypothetical protein Q8Q62_02230, partial [Mesorhizobium sp.]|nr:hypothetical protein [Mesorhizobium sp.]